MISKNPLFWADYYWNRFLCLFGLHIVIPLPSKYADEQDKAGRPICCVCEKRF